MSRATLQLFAIFLMRAIGPSTFITFILVLLAVGIGVLVVILRVIVGERIDRIRSRDWPTVSAVVDIVSVAYFEPGGSPILYLKASSYNPYYKATLTYIYNNPEEQIGDYSREFTKKEDAEAWANSYKGKTVKVHVDPRDSTRSVLRDEDL